VPCVPVGGGATGADGLECTVQADGSCVTVAPGVGYDHANGCVRQADGTCFPVPEELRNYVEVWGLAKLSYLSDPKNVRSQPKTEDVWVPAVLSPGPRPPTPQERAALDNATADGIDWMFGGSVLLPFYRFELGGHQWAAIYTPRADEVKFNGQKWATSSGLPWLPGTITLSVWEGSGEDAIAAAVSAVLDFFGGLGCDGVLGEIGKGFAKAYGMGALHDARCGTSGSSGGGSTSHGGIPTWGYLAAGGVLLAGLGALAFWPRKKKNP
jgi:hypothetical protein